MCVIVHLGANKSVSWKQLEACYKTNSHGWGIMWAKDGKLHQVKNVSPFADFSSVWKDVPRDVERAIHFRIKTHGTISKDNCHPFNPMENIGLMHNGVIDTHQVEKNMSDTFNFTEYELKPVMAGWPGSLDDPSFKDLLEKTTGYSKLLLMDNTGKVLKIREAMWTERNGIFFSNSHSLNTLSSNTDYSYYGSNADYWENGKRYHRGQRGNNYYRNMDNGADEVVSDLYSGNKTDTEGQNYIDRKEDEREATEEAADEKLKQISERIDVETEEEEPLYTLDLEQFLAMSEQDKLDWVQDYPRSAAYMLGGLMDTLAQAGIFDIDYKNKVTILDGKSVVNG